MHRDFDREEAGERIFNAVTRTGKSIALAAVLFTSLYIAGVAFEIAVAIALIPLILSLLNFLPRLGNAAAIIGAIFAIGWILVPEEIRTVVRNVLPT